MGKKRKLTHEEIWDDSELIASWDDAVEEYKKYHSIHARGENIEEVLREYEAAEAEKSAAFQKMRQGIVDGATSAPPTAGAGPDEDDHEDGEIDEEDAEIQEDANGENFVIQPGHHAAGSEASQDTAPLPPGVKAAKDLMSSSGHDENLKNLMMSWYYAGYYTGFYEGQAQSQALKTQATEISANGIPEASNT